MLRQTSNPDCILSRVIVGNLRTQHAAWSYLAMFGVAAFGNDRGAMLKPPPQQCLSNCLAILLCNMGYFCILHHTLAVFLQASRGFP